MIPASPSAPVYGLFCTGEELFAHLVLGWNPATLTPYFLPEVLGPDLPLPLPDAPDAFGGLVSLEALLAGYAARLPSGVGRQVFVGYFDAEIAECGDRFNYGDGDGDGDDPGSDDCWLPLYFVPILTTQHRIEQVRARFGPRPMTREGAKGDPRP